MFYLLFTVFGLYYTYNKFFKYIPPIIVSIDGNIGSGKSTFMKIIKQKFQNKFYFAKEPVEDWLAIQDEESTNILEKFYQDKERWGYTFQNLAFVTRKREMDRALKSGKRIIFTERSIYTDYHIFCKSLYEDGYISKIEMECYKLWFNLFEYPTTYQVYIKTNLDNCQKRIQLRNRQGEDSISEDYLRNLETLHDDWLLEDDDVLVLDGNLDFKNNSIISDHMIHQINDKWNLSFE